MFVLCRALVLSFLVLFSFPILADTASAESLNIDITKLSPDVAKSLIQDIQDQKKAKDSPVAVTPSQAHEWAGVGKEVAAAISETAKGLSLEVNQFVNTPVGWWAMFFLIWTVLGVKLVKLAVGGFFVLVGTFVWWKSLRHFYWGDYEFSNIETQVWCSILHAAGAVFLGIITCVLIFGVL